MGHAVCNLREHPRVTFLVHSGRQLLSLPLFTEAVPSTKPPISWPPFLLRAQSSGSWIPGTSVDRPQSHLPYFLPSIRPGYRCSVAACIWAPGLCRAPRWGRGADVAAKCRPRLLSPWRRRGGRLWLAAPVDRIRRRQTGFPSSTQGQHDRGQGLTCIPGHPGNKQ